MNCAICGGECGCRHDYCKGCREILRATIVELFMRYDEYLQRKAAALNTAARRAK